MKPVLMVRDPFRQGRHKIVLCEPEYADKRNKDVEFNTRKKLEEVMDKVKEHEVWFGIEQEFTITDQNDIPLDWKINHPYIDLNGTLEMGDHVGFERQLVDLHLRACLYAGLEMYGINREMNPSQWEFQVGPLPGTLTADHVIVARYVLIRLAEIHGVKYHSLTQIALGTQMLARHFISTLVQKIHGQKAVLNGEEMKWYLDGDFYMPSYHTFKYSVGDKDKASIRIPTHVFNEGKGYLEERRPVSNADPYDVCRVFTIAALFDHKGQSVL